MNNGDVNQAVREANFEQLRELIRNPLGSVLGLVKSAVESILEQGDLKRRTLLVTYLKHAKANQDTFLDSRFSTDNILNVLKGLSHITISVDEIKKAPGGFQVGNSFISHKDREELFIFYANNNPLI